MLRELDPGGFSRRDFVVRLDPRGTQPTSDLVVEIALDESDPVATVEFPRQACPRLRVGEKVPVRLEHRSLGGGLLAAGRVVFRSEDPIRHCYRFQFGDKERAALGPLVNRRAAVRVRPGAELRAGVRTAEGADCGELPVHDVSTGGISLLVTPEQEQSLYGTTALQLELTLTEGDSSCVLDLAGVVRNRRLSGSAITYGVEFDEDASPRFARSQEVLGAYVRARQLKELRRARSRAKP